MMFLPILLQVEEGDGIPKADERILRNDGDVVGPEVEVPESVQRPESVAGDLVQVVVAQTQVLQVLCAKTKKYSISLYLDERAASGTHVDVQLTQIVPPHLRCRVNVNYAVAQRAASRVCCVCHCLRLPDTHTYILCVRHGGRLFLPSLAEQLHTACVCAPHIPQTLLIAVIT